MSKRNEQELFLDYIKDIYLAYPNFDINKDTIYKELTHFYEKNGTRKRIESNGLLLNVQQRLAKRFGSKFSQGGYFWFYENRGNLSDNDYYNKLYGAVKLYISSDAESLYDVTTRVIEYMQKENIITQSKVAKNMRNDVLVVRVSNSSEAKKVIDFVNSLDYQSNIKPNPFTCSSGKVSVTKDGSLSYNETICKLICNYLKNCKSKNKLDNANIDDLYKYINDTIKMLNSPYKKETMELYGINNLEKYNDILMVLDIMLKNIDGTINLEDIFKESQNNRRVNDSTSVIEKDDREKIKYVLSSLSKYYSTNDVHKIIMKYINEGKLEVFTRKDNIRQVMSSFTPQKLDIVINEMSSNALSEAIVTTRNKYPEYNQSEYAIKLFILSGDLSGFTNDNNTRSYLGMVSPPSKILHNLANRLSSEGQNILYGIFNLSDDKRNLMKMILKNKKDLSSVSTKDITEAKDNLFMLDNLAHMITDSIYKENDKNKKIMR